MRLRHMILFLCFWFYLATSTRAMDLENNPHGIEHCCICTDSLRPAPGSSNQEAAALTTLPCKHIFHTACLETSMYQFQNFLCPLCRQEIPLNLWKLGFKARLKYLQEKYPERVRLGTRCIIGSICIGVTSALTIAIINIVQLLNYMNEEWMI